MNEDENDGGKIGKKTKDEPLIIAHLIILPTNIYLFLFSSGCVHLFVFVGQSVPIDLISFGIYTVCSILLYYLDFPYFGNEFLSGLHICGYFKLQANISYAVCLNSKTEFNRSKKN